MKPPPEMSNEELFLVILLIAALVGALGHLGGITALMLHAALRVYYT